MANSPGFSALARSRVAEIVQPIDQLAVGERLAAAELERTREHAWQHAIAFAVQPRVDEMGEADVVVDAQASTGQDRAGPTAPSASERTQRLRQTRDAMPEFESVPELRSLS